MKNTIKATAIAAGIAIWLPAAADEMAGMDMSAKAEKTAHGVGVIKSIDAKQGSITLAHQPITELSWPAMTMAFKVSDSRILKGRAVGEKVAFELRGGGTSPVVTSIQPVR